MGVVVDSSVIITIERLGRRFDPSAVGIEDEPVALAAMTASELLVGVHMADSPQRRSDRQLFMEVLFSNFEVLPFDLNVARTHARLWAQLAMSGVRIGDRDLIIGATAVANRYSVVTENVRDFTRIPGLTVISPVW